jgi:hypothetical protein
MILGETESPLVGPLVREHLVQWHGPGFSQRALGSGVGLGRPAGEPA